VRSFVGSFSTENRKQSRKKPEGTSGAHASTGMRTISIVLAVGVIGLLLAFCGAGCATTVPAVSPAHEQVQIRVVPWQREVRLVTRAPSSAHYVFVGKVRGVAPDAEFVSAAEHVNVQLREKAAALGADVVKIDRVAPCASGHRVLLAGRAYRRLE
jgi:hypothetical protein